ncbi:UPF0711 protein C18orf21 homolog isoform X2 [Parasteatoda tepidariorum]|uniref:UPF0711 protein C18orf21 homolog isoform X2 n=1 Tax=Parasteatoda tepidariorum TaxID=114398 RepID=UPI0039BC83E0
MSSRKRFKSPPCGKQKFNSKKIIDKSLSNTKEIKKHQCCEHCGSLWSPTNHKVKIQPAAKRNNHIKKLLRWETEQPWKLNNHQKKKLLKYRESSTKIVYTCFCCKKTTKYPCFKRKIQTKEKMTSLYLLPSKVKPVKRDLNAGLLISHQKKNMPTENENSIESISNSDMKIMDKESPSFPTKGLKLSSNPSPIIKLSSTKKQCPSQNVSNTPSLSKKKKKSLLAQILKQEQETAKKKSSLSSFLFSI